eukprot:280634-Pyramimonas_sp.AAC.2
MSTRLSSMVSPGPPFVHLQITLRVQCASHGTSRAPHRPACDPFGVGVSTLGFDTGLWRPYGIGGRIEFSSDKMA